MDEPRDHKFREQWWKLIRADEEVVGDVLAVALLVSTEARSDGTRALMSVVQVAEFLGVSVSTAKRRLSDLRGLGWLELAERGGRRGDGTVTANVYELSLPGWLINAKGDSQQLTQMSYGDQFSTAHRDDPWSRVSTAQNEVSTAHPGDPPL